MKLRDILAKYETDKNIHSYIDTYEQIFSEFKGKANIQFLEVGVLLGGTLLAWKDYFPDADIYGVDIKDRRKEEYKQDRVRFILEDINNVRLAHHWDIIIDDGSHLLEDVKTVVERFLPWLKDDGYLIIEDVQHPARWVGEIWPMVAGQPGYVMDFIDGRHLKNHSEDFLIIIKKTKKLTLDIKTVI